MTQNISNFFRGSFTPNSYEKSLRRLTHEGSRSATISNIAKAVLYYLAIIPAMILDLLMKPRSFSQSFFKNRIVHTLTEAFYKKRVYDPRKVIVVAYAITLAGTVFSIFSLSSPISRLEQLSFLPHTIFLGSHLIILAAGSLFAFDASNSATDANRSATDANGSATAANGSATAANGSELVANRHEAAVRELTDRASTSETIAKTSAESATGSAERARGSADSVTTALRFAERQLSYKLRQEESVSNE